MKKMTRRGVAVVGLDPDKDKTGIAVIKDGEITLSNGCFVDVLRTIHSLKEQGPLEVYLEAAWLTKSNWHLNHIQSIFAASKIGYNIGENHTVGRLLYESFMAMGVNVQAIRPLAKYWKGRDAKISHAELEQQLAACGVSGLAKRSNPEQRDAAVIALWYSL